MRCCPGRGPVSRVCPVCPGPVMHADSLATPLQSAKAYTRYSYALQDQDTQDIHDSQDQDGGESPSMKTLYALTKL